jgi:hypothetical protein
MLTPILKIPLEQGLNLNFFFKDKIEKFEGEKVEWMGFKGTFDARTRHAFGVIRALNEWDGISRAFPGLSSEFRRKTVTDAILRAAFGVKLNRVDLERQKSRVEFERRKDTGALRAAFNRARKFGETANMEIIRRLAAEKGIQLEGQKKQITETEKLLRDLERSLKQQSGRKISDDTFTLEDVQRRAFEIQESQG